LGAGEQSQVISIDLEQTPHLFAAGMTGSGKTRRLLRPLVAQALSNGYQVILMNESGADFSPFYNRPNATIVRGSAADYMAVFNSALGEMGQREAQLRLAKASEWGRLSQAWQTDNPPVLLAIDELLALFMLLSPTEQRQFWGLIAAFASRARKVGMCSIGLATDPTYRALGQGGLNYRTQCARVSFRMMQSSGSRAILDESGAETLEEGQFMALLGEPRVVRGMTANPSDEELRSYLAYNQAPVLPPPTWLETVAPSPETGSVDETGREIQELISQGLSLREIQRQVFGYVGGAAYEAVRQVRDEMTGE
jgi:DNA segregation ATPase FtsK/SpoIIIE-like protein